jgi:drug/metabolite transporter (DMT)-like permease
MEAEIEILNHEKHEIYERDRLWFFSLFVSRGNSEISAVPALMLILACALWGISFPLIKALDGEQRARLPEVSGVFLAAWLQMARFGLAALVMSPFVIRARPTRKEITQGAWLAGWGGLGMALQAWGLGHTEASTSAFLTQAYCVFLPLVACVKARCLPGWKTTFATLLVLTGGVIFSGIKPGDLTIGKGEVATLGAAFIFTFQILTLENPKYSENRGLAVNFTMSVFIALIFLPLSFLTASDPYQVILAGSSWPSFGIVLALALFCSVGAFGLMISWQPRVTATEAGLIYTTEPIFTAGFAMFLPAMLAGLMGGNYANESITISLLAGGLLIVGANILMQWKRRPYHSPVT